MARAAPKARPARRGPPEAVADYKGLLKAVLENRPSGMRLRLAEALGKNRSFVSQIANPAYPAPIPVRHVFLIFEICHFSAQERASFLAAYGRAHPGRIPGAPGGRHERKITLGLPDLGTAKRNQELETLIFDFVHRIAVLVGEGR